MVQFRIPIKKTTTLPKNLLDEASLQTGDELLGIIENGKIILTPKKRVYGEANRPFSSEENRALARARKKIEQINKDIIHSRGLTQKETHVAIKAGLIDKDQAYYWLEEWQKDLRESERDRLEGRVSPTFGTSQDAIQFLRNQSTKQ